MAGEAGLPEVRCGPEEYGVAGEFRLGTAGCDWVQFGWFRFGRNGLVSQGSLWNCFVRLGMAGKVRYEKVWHGTSGSGKAGKARQGA